MSKDAGIILFQVLFLTMLLSFVVQRELQAWIQLSNSSHQFLAQEARLLYLEQAGRTLAFHINKECIIDTVDPNEVIQRLFSKQGCALQFKKHQYFYMVQNLERLHATKHWQLSLADLEKPPLVLQFHFTKTNATEKTIQSWRLLT